MYDLAAYTCDCNDLKPSERMMNFFTNHIYKCFPTRGLCICRYFVLDLNLNYMSEFQFYSAKVLDHGG